MLHMNDVKAVYGQHIEAARQALGRGDRPAAADSFRSAIDAARASGLERELVSALVHLGKLEQELGRAAQAERLLDEALAIGERVHGPEHPSLGVVLNELSRLHIRQANHTRAEAVLDRLLRITRTKGEEHADVATALAGLAVVKRARGADAEAEQHFRDALRIRERVLAPNHMAIVVTLEQLSETCAARDNLSEAVALLRRALPTREAALGGDHATVRAIRSRITDLELRATLAKVARPAAAAVASVPAAAPPPAPAPAPAPSPNDLVFIYQPEPPVRRQPPPRERMTTPAYSAAVAAASLIASPMHVSPPAKPAPSAQTAPSAPSAPERPAPSAPSAAPARASIPTPVADMVIAVAPRVSAPVPASSVDAAAFAAHDVAAREDAASAAVTFDRVAPEYREARVTSSPADADEPQPKKRTVLYASVGAVAVALAIAGMMFRPASGGGNDREIARAATDRRPAPATPALTTELGAAAMAAGARPDSVRTVSTAPQPPAPKIQAASRTAAAAATAETEPSAPAVPGGIDAVNVPIIATTNVDSMVRATSKVGKETYTDQIVTSSVGLRTSPGVDDATGRPPMLIGRAPTPYFPDALRSQRTEGEVVMRFRVDEHGRIDMSSVKVVKSDHELFTLAVRNVLPRFRFEPARSPAPESKPRADWVDFRTEFTAKN
ncbi:MAG TPA: tetratricopeptide repeat protein [Gemmatimonadaceae bacterium]|nr:tetratricopeptide repeat protein [Gemmatimonadaceae bacterium]